MLISTPLRGAQLLCMITVRLTLMLEYRKAPFLLMMYPLKTTFHITLRLPMTFPLMNLLILNCFGRILFIWRKGV